MAKKNQVNPKLSTLVRRAVRSPRAAVRRMAKATARQQGIDTK